MNDINKLVSKIISVAISLVTIFAFLFISDFAKAAHGWIGTTYVTVILTLIAVLAISILFIFYGHRSNRIYSTYVITSIFLYIGYFGFLFNVPDSFSVSQFWLTLGYVIGECGIFLTGFLLIRLLARSKENTSR